MTLPIAIMCVLGRAWVTFSKLDGGYWKYASILDYILRGVPGVCVLTGSMQNTGRLRDDSELLLSD